MSDNQMLDVLVNDFFWRNHDCAGLTKYSSAERACGQPEHRLSPQASNTTWRPIDTLFVLEASTVKSHARSETGKIIEGSNLHLLV